MPSRCAVPPVTSLGELVSRVLEYGKQVVLTPEESRVVQNNIQLDLIKALPPRRLLPSEYEGVPRKEEIEW